MAGQTETVLAAILQGIETGTLNPGDMIEEQSLLNDHGVSRTPVREAFIQLESLGLIRRLPRKGAVVFKPNLSEFLVIVEVHAKLEGHAAALASRRLTESGKDQLNRIVEACEEHSARFGETRHAEYYDLNLRFHETVAVGANNPFLLDLIKTNARKLMAYYRARYRYPGAVADSAMEHRSIAAAIIAQDRETSENLMEQHVTLDQATVRDLMASFG